MMVYLQIYAIKCCVHSTVNYFINSNAMTVLNKNHDIFMVQKSRHGCDTHKKWF